MKRAADTIVLGNEGNVNVGSLLPERKRGDARCDDGDEHKCTDSEAGGRCRVVQAANFLEEVVDCRAVQRLRQELRGRHACWRVCPRLAE